MFIFQPDFTTFRIQQILIKIRNKYFHENRYRYEAISPTRTDSIRLEAALRSRFAKWPKNGYQEIGCVIAVLGFCVPEEGRF